MPGTTLNNALILTQLVHDGQAYQLAVASFTQSVDVGSQEVHPEVQKLLDSPVFTNHMLFELVDELKDGWLKGQSFIYGVSRSELVCRLSSFLDFVSYGKVRRCMCLHAPCICDVEQYLVE